MSWLEIYGFRASPNLQRNQYHHCVNINLALLLGKGGGNGSCQGGAQAYGPATSDDLPVQSFRNARLFIILFVPNFAIFGGFVRNFG